MNYPYKKSLSVALTTLILLVLNIPSSLIGGTTACIENVGDEPQLEFAVGDLVGALEATGHPVREDGEFRIDFTRFADGMGPQSFRIERVGERGIRVTAGDADGAMYGALELAEQIRLGGGLEAVREMARKPYVLRRGIKFNIPFDGRTPSYDDTGTAAQENIAVMWDFAFWKHFIDELVRNRYNVLSLWTTHPYPGMVELPEYPGVNFDDVGRITREITPDTNNHFNEYDVFDPANHEIILKISLQEKIAYWTKVFDYAKSRGMEIYMFHWNIFLWNAEGKHGISHAQDDPETIAYVRYAIRRFLETYPQIDGIGVSAGEYVNRKKDWSIGIEDWLYETYGMAVLDTVKADPDRQIRFIFRHLWSDLEKSAAAFEGYDVPFNTSHKYARARIYSTTTSPYLDTEYRDKLERTGVPCWLNLRNDDYFVHRWGDAAHVREFLQNIPRDVMQWEAGYYMGPDSYVYGKEFVAMEPELSGQWEIDKHWYRFMLWGRLGYDLSLDRPYFEARLAERYPELPADLLYDTWAEASRIVPQVNRFFFRVNDLQFAPEACISKWGFLTVDESFFKYPPLAGSGLLSVQEYAEEFLAGGDYTGTTPHEVADHLEQLAGNTMAGAEGMRNAGIRSAELAATIADMESMAWLGLYYADKIRAAADLAVWRADGTQLAHLKTAVGYFEDAVRDWEAYAANCTARYKPQLLSRTGYLDWEQILEEVRKEAGHWSEILGQQQESGAARYGEDGTPYPLYAIEFGLEMPVDEESIDFLTTNFDAYFGSIEVSGEMADLARQQRPDFDILHYIGNWRVNRAARQRVESGERDGVLYYHLGNLVSPVDEQETVLSLDNVYGSLPRVQETGQLAWLRVGEEWMRITSVDGSAVTVERGWDGSSPVAHPSGSVVLAPAVGSMDQSPDRPFSLRHDTSSPIRWEQILAYLMDRYEANGSGIWIDILIGNFATYTLGGETVPMASGRQWDLRRNRPYTPDAISLATKRAVSFMQNEFHRRTGNWPVIWANNMEFPRERGEARLQLLLPSDEQHRPLDGFAMENMYAHWGYGGASGKNFMWVPYDEWREHLQSLMLMGELRVNARPLMFDGGIDNLKFARLSQPERERLIEYGYASYLLGVQVEPDDTIYTKLGSCPVVVESDPATGEERARFHLYDCFTWDIGRPAETHAANDYLNYRIPGTDVFARRFENGIVLVNPTAGPSVPVSLADLGGPFIDQDSGNPAASSLMLGPRTGRILLFAQP